MTYPTHLRVLALDLATNVGWAMLANGILTHGEQSNHRKHGLKRTPDEHPGIAYHRFDSWLTDFLNEQKPALIVTEYSGFFKSAAARDICCGFRGILLAQCAKRGLPLFSYSPAHIKKFWTGAGNADKDLMMTSAAVHGFTDVGPDECDAIAMLHLHLNQQPNP